MCRGDGIICNRGEKKIVTAGVNKIFKNLMREKYEINSQAPWGIPGKKRSFSFFCKRKKNVRKLQGRDLDNIISSDEFKLYQLYFKNA